MQFSRLNLLFALAAAQEWNEQWRPQFHQSTPLGWGNDPNGMVFDGSRYHLFYQHYPDGLTWGPMHWGHSSSEDLLTWEHHPVAIKPAGIRDDDPVVLEIDGVPHTIPEHEWPNVGMAFSGSAFLDAEGRFGQGENAIILMWTDHTEIKEPREFRRERQSMGYLKANEGYSTVHHWNADTDGIQNDAESNMHFYEGTEMRPAVFETDIRDPKIIKYDDTTQLAILANCDRVVIYSAPLGTTNQWVPKSAFGVNNGKLDTDLDLSTHDPQCEIRGRTDGIWGGLQGGVWECPDLIRMRVEGEDEELWVMIVSIGANNGVNDGPNSGSATMYFVGRLDANFQFQPVEDFDAYPKWVDYGPDSYAGVTYDNTSPPVFQAWMSNWLYANEVPTGEHGWRSGMTLPRALRLVNRGTQTDPEYRLVHKFVDLTPLYDDIATGDILASNKIPSSHPIYSVGVEVNVDFLVINTQEEGEYTITFYGKPTVDEENVIRDPIDFVQVGLFVDASGKQEFRVIRSSEFVWDSEETKEDKPTPAEFFERASVARAPRMREAKEYDTLKVHAVFDTASVEVLFDDGEVSMTSLSFPLNALQRVSVYASGGMAMGKYAALHSTVYEHTTTTPFPTTTSPTTTLPPAPTTTTEPETTPAPTCPAVTCPLVTCPEAPTCPDCGNSAASPLITASIGMISAAALYLMA